MKQLGGLEEDRAKFEEKGAQIIVVAVQSQKAAETSKMAARVHFPFLADTDHAVADAFGVFNLLEDPIMQNEATPAVCVVRNRRELRPENTERDDFGEFALGVSWGVRLGGRKAIRKIALWFFGEEEVGLHGAFAFDIDRAAGLADEVVLEDFE